MLHSFSITLLCLIRLYFNVFFTDNSSDLQKVGHNIHNKYADHSEANNSKTLLCGNILKTYVTYYMSGNI